MKLGFPAFITLINVFGTVTKFYENAIYFI